MAVVSGLQVFAISVWPLPSNSGNVSSPLATQVQSVSNGAASSGPQASGVGGSARRPPSLFRTVSSAVCGGSHDLYIGKSVGRRIRFDTTALLHSRPGDMSQENAEFKIARLELRHYKRQLDLKRAVECDNGEHVNKFLEVNSRRLSQAQALKTRLGDALSEQIRLDDLINLYESFSVGITNRRSRTPGTPNQAETRV